ncbi:MAG: PilZ domain-containing protein [Nitrospirae bacterium]|nr:PilZ domain-containing protein [Nitrospirota bacterium]
MEEHNETIKPTKPPDRRNDLREPIIVFKVVEDNNQEHLFGYAKNISRSGLFIASINPREPGEQFYITFQIPKTGIRARCQCEVVWIRRYKQGSTLEPGYGIRFLNLTDDIALAIDNWIARETLEMLNDE